MGNNLTISDTASKSSRSEITQALSLLRSLPRRATDTGQGKLNLEAYFIALEGVTRWGLSEAIKAILKGALGHGFMPSPPELRRQYEVAMKPVYDQWQRANREAREMAERQAERKTEIVRTPEARAKIAATYAAFCASHPSKQSVSEPDAFRIEADDPRLASIPDAKTGWRKAAQR